MAAVRRSVMKALILGSGGHSQGQCMTERNVKALETQEPHRRARGLGDRWLSLTKAVGRRAEPAHIERGGRASAATCSESVLYRA